MFLCDTHADTLYRMQMSHVTEPMLDVRMAHFSSDQDTRVQVMALFVGGNSLKGKDEGIIERELRAFSLLKERGANAIGQLSEAKAGQMNLLLSIEGGEAFLDDPEQVSCYRQMGICMATLIWNNPNALATPAISGETAGLTKLGKQIVSRMHRDHMAVDISHLNVAGTYDVLETGMPPLASHSCAYALCPHKRNLSDDQLRALFSAKGFVGVNFYPPFLSENGKADVNRVVDHLSYFCDLGGEAFVGLGSDFDGIEEKPIGLENASCMQNLFDCMQKRGFGKSLITRIAGQNFSDYVTRIL